jgi:hypothetical protein
MVDEVTRFGALIFELIFYGVDILPTSTLAVRAASA